MFITALVAVVTFFAAVAPPLHIFGMGSESKGPLYPAPAGYQLPWEGGRIHAVTQGEETGFTHNGLAAYGYDFDMNYDTVVAARSGKVTHAYEASNAGGCNATFSGSANYVVVDHGDGTSALYLHLAHASVVVEIGQEVEQGSPLGISGETGVTCSDDNSTSAPHLHFQIQRTDSGYFTQSLPVAFDDIPSNEGVPVEGESYVSGNFANGKPQKIKLTPYRVPRVFNPVATPSDPALLEAVPHTPTPTPEPPLIWPEVPATETTTPINTPIPLDTATPEFTETAEPEETDTPEPSPTPVPSTLTPEPSATETPAPQSTPTVGETPTVPPDPTSSSDPPATEPPGG